MGGDDAAQLGQDGDEPSDAAAQAEMMTRSDDAAGNESARGRVRPRCEQREEAPDTGARGRKTPRTGCVREAGYYAQGTERAGPERGKRRRYLDDADGGGGALEHMLKMSRYAVKRLEMSAAQTRGRKRRWDEADAEPPGAP